MPEVIDIMAFCDYCTCSDCKSGAPWLVHAQTESGKWICDVCFNYECCLRAGYNPCDKQCSHRPKLISEWIKYDPDQIY